MVREANIKQAAAEKQRKEAQGKVSLTAFSRAKCEGTGDHGLKAPWCLSGVF